MNQSTLNGASADERSPDMSDTDEKTLCALQEEGFIESNTEDYKKLINPPRFFCQNCGRAAVKSNNLCNPADL